MDNVQRPESAGPDAGQAGAAEEGRPLTSASETDVTAPGPETATETATETETETHTLTDTDAVASGDGVGEAAVSPAEPMAPVAPDSLPTAPPAPPPARRGTWGMAVLMVLAAALGAGGGTAATYALLREQAPVAPGAGTVRVVNTTVSDGWPVVFNGPVDATALYRQAAPAVVEIRTLGGRQRPRGSGTGFIFDAKGYILTNYHVVDTSKEVQVHLDDGTILPGSVLGVDPGNDLAVVAIHPGNRQLPVLVLGDSNRLQPGEPAIAIGYPLGEGKSVTGGIISGVNRSAESPSGWQQLGMIQTDAALNPGNSGGPLLNAAGEVIGVNAQVVSNFGGIGLAVPINVARQLLPDLIAGREVRHAWLGISGSALTPQVVEENRLPAKQGVIVFEVLPGSGAKAAGLAGARRLPDGGLVLGDVILALDGQPVTEVTDIATHLRGRAPGDTVTLTLLRRGEEVQLPVQLRPRPDVQP